MASIARWAEQQGYDYLKIGDELFDKVKPPLRKKLLARKPILADLARLDWLSSVLADRGGRALWIDADTLNLDPDWSLPETSHSFFGEECWVQQDQRGRWQTHVQPHNAFMGFSADSPVLPFLRFLSESLIERADPDRIAPQMIGPKLLKTLHNLAQFELIPEAGAVSPALLAEWVGQRGEATLCYEGAGRPELAMVNLCASLANKDHHQAHIERLIRVTPVEV